ncbi:MAG: VOC family protein [Actinobacteria bacterium]|nr:VOC family protein [Actinomycetota bacterium]
MTMHIGHVALRVLDIDRAAELQRQALGLREVWRDENEVRLTAGNKSHELQLLRSPVSGLDHIGLEVESDDELQAVYDRALASGAEAVEDFPSEDGLGRAVRFIGPADIVYEVHNGMARAALAPDEFKGRGARRLGHLGFIAEHQREILAFWIDALGFRISDEIPGEETWTRCDFDHHGLGAALGESGDVLHHVAWEVQDLPALAQLCDELSQYDLALSWGPVRHGPGYNISTYMLDTEGSMIEVYTDLLRIFDESTYEPVDWSNTPRAQNLWGPPLNDEVLNAGIPLLRPGSAD